VCADEPALDAFVRGPLAPLGAVALSIEDAAALALPGPGWLLRLGGNAPFVAAARQVVRSLGDASDVDPAVWTAVRERCAPPSRATTWRWDALSLALRAQFDPAGILNPGLLGATR